MKLLLTHILPGLLLAPLLLIAQNRDEDTLAWSSLQKLTWADYKASPNPESDAAASTTTFLSIQYHITGNNLEFKIQSKFSKTDSWGLHKTDYILSHEQGHFDIAEIFARKLYQKMSEYTFNRKTFQNDLKKIYEEITGEKEEMQNEYDNETRHSINRTKQAEWLKKIQWMLEDYEDYAGY